MSESATPFIAKPAVLDAGLLSATGVEGAGDEGPEFSGTQRFRVVKQLGAGGMGRVYEVEDTESGGRVALKLLRRLAPASILLFKTEFRALQDVSHENLVSLGELFEEEGQWFLTMELVKGQDFLSFVRGVSYDGLGAAQGDGATAATATATASTFASEVVGRRGGLQEAPQPAPGRLFERRLRGALRQLCRGLMALHGAHKAHRDIKPSNILVTTAGRVVLLDFGLVADWRQGVEQGVFGTISYMAPEQFDGKIGPASDWYSVGVLLYRALTGRLPYDGSQREILTAKRLRPPPPPSQWLKGLPSDLEALCMDLMRLKPEERPTGSQVWERLRAHERVARPASMDGLEEGSSHPGKFWGRQAESKIWDEALAKVRDGVGTSLLFEGESGVGKSALMQQCLRNNGDALVLSGRCYERESIRYKGVDGLIDALTGHLLTLPTSEVEAILPVRAHLLTQAFPVLGRVSVFEEKKPVAVGDAVRRRSYTFAALRELLWRLAERSTLVLAIDDLQWADADSLALLSEVLKAPDAPPLLFVATVRTESGGSSLVGLALDGMGEVRRCALGPLAPEEAQGLARALVEGREDDSFADDIAKESGGHPLFIAELTRHARQSVRGQGLSLDEALWGRVARLPKGVQDILKAVCIAGVPVLQSVVAEVVGIDSFPQFSSHLAQLRSGNLARTSGPRPTDTVQAYHDRVREAVTGHVEPALKATTHKRIAMALERRVGVEPEVLALHWREAGEPRKAAGYAADAAGRAAASLAFDKAVALYRMALECSPENPEAPALRVKLADALANLGNGAEAASTYLSVVHALDPLQALDVRRRAADQFLRVGQVDEGLGTLNEVLASVGLKLPKNPRAALLRLLWRRFKLWIRGLRFTLQDPSAVSPLDLQRMDATWAVAVGSLLTDFVGGAASQAEMLLLALRTGESSRLALALAFESLYREGEGGSNRGSAARLLSSARQLAAQCNMPYVSGWVEMSAGFGAAQRGHLAQGIDFLNRAEAIFKENCPGTTWELDFSAFIRTWLLAMQGQFLEMSQQLRILFHGRSRNNIRLLQTRTLVGHLAHLARDDPRSARADVDAALAIWNRPGLDMQHVYAFYASVQISLYVGQLDLESIDLAEQWKRFDRSLLGRAESIKLFMTDLRARISILRATRKGPGWRQHLRNARRMADEVSSCSALVASPLSELLRAQIHFIQNQLPQTIESLQKAGKGFVAAEMHLHYAVTQWRLGQIVIDQKSLQMIADAQTFMRDQGIAKPARFLRMMTPGFERTTESYLRLERIS